jgi:hypothetical protein
LFNLTEQNFQPFFNKLIQSWNSTAKEYIQTIEEGVPSPKVASPKEGAVSFLPIDSDEASEFKTKFSLPPHERLCHGLQY